MTEARPTLHHLNVSCQPLTGHTKLMLMLQNSQSMRILWLLEELGIEYDLKLYERYKSGKKQARAPDELKEIHPLGKSPIFVTATGRVLIESEAIVKYLIREYDTSKKFQGDPSTNNDEIRDDILTSFGSTSLNMVMMIETMLQVVVKQSPFFVRPLFKALHSQVHSVYTGSELENSFKFLETELGDQDYFMGTNPGCADFILSWPFDYCVQWKFVDLKKYPKLDQYYARCSDRAAWKRAREKGNGYQLVVG